MVTKTEEVKARITASQAEKLQRLGELNGMNKSQVLRGLIELVGDAQPLDFFALTQNKSAASVLGRTGSAFVSANN